MISCVVVGKSLCYTEVDKAGKEMIEVEMIVEVDVVGFVPQLSKTYSNGSCNQSCRYSNTDYSSSISVRLLV